MRNDGVVVVADYLSGNYETITSYSLPADFVEIVDIEKFNGEFYVSAMGIPETTGIPSKVVRGSSLSVISSGLGIDMYSSLGMLGKPYFFEIMDSLLILGEVGIDYNSLVTISSAHTPAIIHRTIGVHEGSYKRSAMYPK